MEIIVGQVELDTLASSIIVGRVEFDVRSVSIVVGSITFDTMALPPLVDAPPVGGGKKRSLRTLSVAKSTPSPVESTYHSRAYEQDEREAAELDDEETILAFLMELDLV